MAGDNSKLLIIILWVLLVLFVVTAVFVFGIYRLGWDNEAARAFVQVVPLPAAMLKSNDGTWFVSQAEVFVRLAADPGVQRETITLELVEGEMVSNVFRKRGLARSPNRPDLERAKLKVSLFEEDKASFARAKQTLELIKNGLDFTEAAKLYSQDEASRFIGGDLGFVTRFDLLPWLADSAFDLEISEVSEVVISPAGFHILKVVVRDDSADPGRIQLRHILITGASFEEFLEKERKNYKVYIFGQF